MPGLKRFLIGLAAITGTLVPTSAQQVWTSPHLTIEKFATWSEFLDVLNQPHIDMVISNDGTQAIGSYAFRCRLVLADRAKPVFEGSWSTDLDHVVHPGEKQTVKLRPNMFSEAGEVIQHHYPDASWSCYVSHILTAAGQSISFEPGQLPTEGPPFGVSYAPVPPNMAPLLKVQAGTGMWVIKVKPGSGADASGLKQGDVILAIDGNDLKVVADLPDALGAARQAGHPARLAVVRAGKPIEIEAKPAAAGMASNEGLVPDGAGQPGVRP